MTAILTEYDAVFDVRRFPPGHTVQACAGVEARARPLGYADLLRLVAAAKAAAMLFIGRKARRQTQKLARGEGQTGPIDARVDGNWGQIHDLLTREAAGYGDTPDGELAAKLLEQVFPKGLAAVTRIPYEEQVALNEYLVVLIREQFPDAPAQLGFERPLRRIEQLLPGYRDSLSVVETITALEVGEAYAAMQVALLRVIAWIMAMVEDEAERAALMAPVRDQMKRLAAAHAARRQGKPAVEDVPLDTLELDPEARAAVDAVAAAEAELQAEAQAEAAADDAAQDQAEGDLPLQAVEAGADEVG